MKYLGQENLFSKILFQIRFGWQISAVVSRLTSRLIYPEFDSWLNMGLSLTFTSIGLISSLGHH